MEEERQPTEAHLKVLKMRFGHSKFRPKQWEIIRSIIQDEQDSCVVMATGYGKSLLYQYPSVYRQGLTIVISPLISLMEDQVRSLVSRNIPACFLGSAQPNDLKPGIIGGKYRIVYITPEYAMGETGQTLLKDVSNQLNLIAIDEAYCLNKLGDHFRKDYGKLGEIRRNPMLSHVPILAVSAVATPRVRKDIVAELGLENEQIWCTGFDRPNLNFHVRMKGFDIWKDVKDLISEYSKSSIIIYCLTRELTNEMAKLLRNNGIKCETYHPKISLEKRSEAQKAFMENRVKIMVSTVAFGMGIDKPDVRLVIHYGAPMELETYYLAAGLAGRDGKQSKCVMFWSEKDFDTHEYIRFIGLQEDEVFEEMQNDHDTQSSTMRNYLDTKECRRKFIRQYFEGINPSCCDNCEASSGQFTPKNKRHPSNEADIQSENPSPIKQHKMEHNSIMRFLKKIDL